MLSSHRNTSPISRDSLIAAVPAVTALSPHYSRSDRYGHATTLDVVDAFLSRGYEVHGCQSASVRKVDRQGYQRHMVRLRQPSTEIRAIGDSVPEVCIVNSHDGTSSFQVSAGLLRLVCLNGLMVGSAWQSYRIAHRSHIVPQVIDATYSVVEQFDGIASRVSDMQRVMLTNDQARDFAARAHALRYGEDDDDAADANAPARILPSPDRLLAHRRWDDARNDLWSVFNRVQENVVRGGLVTVGRIGRRNARRTSRPVGTIDGAVKINRGLWDIAESFLAAA
jgi:hypothetical protein